MDFHFAFCINNEYAEYIQPAIMALKEISNNSPDIFIIHIISDRISNKNLHRIHTLFDGEKFILKIHIVNFRLKELKKLKSNNWPFHIWFRIILSDILDKSIERILYLDADTLVLSNISELFSLNMRKSSIAAAIDYQNMLNEVFNRCKYEKKLGYICSGVLLINLRYWRENNISKKIIDWAKDNEDNIKCPDQDAINYICRDSKIILPMKYGIMDCFLTNPLFEEKGYTDQIEECRRDPKIIHYNGCPPWYKEYKKHTFHKEWEKFNKMLPHPVKPRYQAKGILKARLIVYRFLTSFFFNAKDKN